MSVAVSVIAIILGGGSLVYTTSVLQGVDAKISTVKSDVQSSVNSVKGDIKGLSDLVGLYGQALGVGTVDQARKIIEQKKAQEELVAAARKEGKVNFYASPDKEDVDRWIAAFNRKYPDIKVEHIQATPAVLLERIKSEQRGGKESADVTGFSRPTVEVMKKDGMLLKYSSPELAAYPAGAYDSDGYWNAFNSLILVGMYRTDRIKPEDLPKTFPELADAKWKGKIVVGDPLSGAAGTYAFAAIEAEPTLGATKAMDAMKALAKTKPPFVSSTSAQGRQVVSGEYDLSFVNYIHEAKSFKEAGAPVEIFWFPGYQVPVSANTLAILSQGKHPSAAKLWVDFLLSDEGQRTVAGSGWRLNVRPGVSAKYSIDEVVPPGWKLAFHANEKFWKDITSYLKLFEQIFFTEVGRPR